jgi:hypothetical protein
VVLAIRCVPGLDVNVALTECNCTKSTPENHSCRWEEVNRWNKEGIHYKKSIKEVQTKQELLEKNVTVASVTLQYLPIPNALFAISTKPVIPSDSQFVNKEKT